MDKTKMNSYKYYNYCTRCKITFKKTVTRCPDCKQRIRTKPKGQFGKKNLQIIRY